MPSGTCSDSLGSDYHLAFDSTFGLSPMRPLTTMSTTRRHFLRTSSTLLALPWLESLAGAAAPAPPKRMVSICTNFGLYGPSFFPEQAGRDYQPSEYLKVLGDLRSQFTVFSGIAHPEMAATTRPRRASLPAPSTPPPGAFATASRSITSPPSTSAPPRASRCSRSRHRMESHRRLAAEVAGVFPS